MTKTKGTRTVNTQKTATAPRVVGKRHTARKRETRAAAALPAVVPEAPEAQPARHNDVRERAMLVNLTIHQWEGKATDLAITDEVAKLHGIADDMGKYQKQLLSKTSLARLRTAGNQLRSVHNRFTLPWDEWGTRILSSKAFLAYRSEVRAGIDNFDQVFKDELEAIGETGVSKYEEAKAEARRLLNGAFREADYPSIDKLRAKFRAHISILPIPSGEDFRLDLGAEATDQVRQEIEARSSGKLAEAMKGLFERLHVLVAKLVDALKAENPEAIRKTLFTSIETLLEALPGLNVAADPALDLFASDIQALVSGLNAKDLRECEPMRATVLLKADAILAKMNDFLG
jgi:hypothetical protein